MVHAQDDYEAYTLVVQNRLVQFHSDMVDISTHIATASAAGIGDLQRSFNSLDVRWNTYCTAQQGYIADREELLAIVAQYQQTRQMVADSLENCRARLLAADHFNAAIRFMQDKLADYDRIQRRCDNLAMTQQTAEQLERVKAAEQLTFGEITERYQQAKSAVDLNPALKKEEQQLDELYLDLSTRSEHVQATVYKSLIEKAKDYLLGIAAVAIVLMFVSMLQNKIQATKQMRESMKRLKEQYIKEGQDDIPSI